MTRPTHDTTHTTPRRAVVIGASMAGLLAARTLSDQFDEVWLLERDKLPDGAAPRKGTPHAGHAHGLLARGRQVMEELFPGLCAALVAQGALMGDLGQDASFIAGGRRFLRGPTGLVGLGVSRIRLEAEIRRRVLALPGVRLRGEVDVTGLAWSATRDVVTGVHLTTRGSADGAEFLAAELVVDASGRASRLPAWLQEQGYDAPPEERVGEGASVGYATACFERDPAVHEGAVICSVTPALPIGGVLLPQEGDTPGRARWVMTLGGYGADQPAPTRESMLAHVRRLGCAEMLDVLQHARPIGEPARYQFAYSRRRRYEALQRFPQRLLAVGDAICSFNPIYGQGMTVAACEALALREAVARGLDAGLHRRYFRAAGRIVDTPWGTAVGTDLALDFVPGPRTRGMRMVNAFVHRVQVAAARDRVVAAAFLAVAHLVRPPASLFAPGILARVLRAGLAEAWSRPPAASPHQAAA